MELTVGESNVLVGKVTVVDNPKDKSNDKSNDNKICRICKEVKNVEIDFYNIGKSKSKYCKKCHNKQRKKYKIKKVIYKPKEKSEKKNIGFARLPAEVQEDIKYMISIKYTKKEIAEKYKDLVKYQTLLRWGRENQL